jgi:hypothetical protein
MSHGSGDFCPTETVYNHRTHWASVGIDYNKMSFGTALAFGLPMISPVNLISQRNGHVVQLPGSFLRAFDLFHIASSSTLAMHGLTQGINL